MKNEIVLYQPDESVQLEVRVQDESVWLSQQQMGELFGVNRQAVTKHLKNIYESNELEESATCSILELVQKEGKRQVRREATVCPSVSSRMRKKDKALRMYCLTTNRTAPARSSSMVYYTFSAGRRYIPSPVQR